MPTVILAKTVKGYGMGAAGEALNPTHGTKKMDDEDVRTFRDRFQIPVTDAQLAERPVPFFHPGEKSPEVEYMHERRKALGGFLPQRRRKTDAGARSAEARRLRPPAQDQRRARDQHHDGVRAGAQHHPARQAGRPALRADRRRRGAHLRHGRHVPPARHLCPARAEVQAGRPRPADVLPRGRRRPGAGGRHHRVRRVLVVDGLRHQLQHQRPADAAVLHLLLDVRLPAHRRQRLAGGGHALARLPARRHRRPHHAQRRRPAARGRPAHGAGRR